MYLDSITTTIITAAPYEITIPGDCIHLPDITGSVALCSYIRRIISRYSADENTLQALINKIGVNKKITRSSTILHLAVSAKCSLSVVKLLLKNGADIKAKDASGNTALHFAVSLNRDLYFVKFLLENGADINAKNADGNTALHLAVSGKDQDISELLLEKRAHINEKNADGNTALLLAVSIKDCSCSFVELLLAKGADIKAKDASDNTALHLALPLNRGSSFIKLLLKNGADINAKNVDGNTALHLAVSGKYQYIAEFLLEKGADINEKNADGNTALLLAVSIKDYLDSFVKLLLANGADINAKNADGNTVLHFAVLVNICSVKFLIENGAPVNAKNADGNTALHLAVLIKTASYFMDFLLKNEADVNAKDAAGNTALHLAVSGKDKDIAKFLLENGAHINEKNAAGNTALHLAASVKNGLYIVEFLLENGAHINEKNSAGNTVLYLAVMKCYKHITELSINAEANIYDQLDIKEIDNQKLLFFIQNTITSHNVHSNKIIPTLLVYFFIKNGSKYSIDRSATGTINSISFFFKNEEYDIKVINEQAINDIVIILKNLTESVQFDVNKVLFAGSKHAIIQSFNENNHSDPINELPIPTIIKDFLENKIAVPIKNYLMLQNLVNEL